MSEQPENPNARPSVAPPARGRRRQLIIGAALTLVLVASVFTIVARPFTNGTADARPSTDGDAWTLTWDGEDFSGERAKQPVRTTPAVARDAEEKYASACASCAAKHEVAAMPAASTTTRVAEGARSEAEVSKLLKTRRKSSKVIRGDDTMLAVDGSAIPPIGAPREVLDVIAAANAIRSYPYIWGGGHGSYQDSGYDCSGSVSYALKGADLIGDPMVSGDFERYGEPGPGKWITIYANAGHVFMVVGGMRFDTSFRDGPYGSRWQTAKRSMSGFVVRHPVGL